MELEGGGVKHSEEGFSFVLMQLLEIIHVTRHELLPLVSMHIQVDDIKSSFGLSKSFQLIRKFLECSRSNDIDLYLSVMLSRL